MKYLILLLLLFLSFNIYGQNIKDGIEIKYNVLYYDSIPVSLVEISHEQIRHYRCVPIHVIHAENIKETDLIILITEEGWEFVQEYGIKLKPYRIYR